MNKTKIYKDIKEFQSIIYDIKHNPAFLETKYFKHHGADNTIYSHSIRTAYFVFKTCKILHLKENIKKVQRLLHFYMTSLDMIGEKQNI